RLLGLADKTLIVDEIHAYDTYTTSLLQSLLTGHARQGGSAILLSATLPLNLRRKLVSAWQQGRNSQKDNTAEDGFPLAALVSDTGVEETLIATEPERYRELPVRFIHSAEQAQEAVVEAARQGHCVCWIRNTVDDAITAFQAIQQELEESERAIVFHARFTMADRQRIEAQVLQYFGKESGAEQRCGRVLIATQVVEQSLDV
ncbi:CRISPR-associated helicase Cas3', partial [Halorhodospira halochloris]|uniref:CRISPR-associated helicase Cas3' n=1 Tax=Halorhodospira halochloris TaxID=1052 RepID=UPI001EE784B4